MDFYSVNRVAGYTQDLAFNAELSPADQLRTWAEIRGAQSSPEVTDARHLPVAGIR